MAAAVVALAMLAGACGSRANDQQVAEALGRTGGMARQASLAAGGDGATSGDTIDGGTPIDAGGEGGTGATAGATAGDGGTGGSAAPGEAGSNAAPEGGNGGATDVGVTGDSITVANVSILTGPVPGLFAGAAYGTDAFFGYQNSQGGVFGRKLKLLVGDDQFDCGRNRAVTEQYASKAFAFVGGFSLYDNCGAEVLAKNPTIPDVHNALARTAGKLPNNFSIAPVRAGAPTGPFNYMKSKHPSAVSTCASLVGDVQSAKDAWTGQKFVMEKLGYRFSYERVFSPTETDFTSDIVRMRTGNVKCVVLIAADAKGIGRIMAAAQQQNWKPDFWLLGASAYDKAMLALAGSAAEGAMLYIPSTLYLGEDEGVAEVKLFLSWMKRTHPDANIDLFSVFGWASARLFVQALQAAGPKVTRAAVIDALKKIDKFDSNGMLAEAGPASKRPTHCYVMVTVKGGKFARADSPGYRCDGEFVYAPGA